MTFMTYIAVLLIGFYAMADMFIISPILGEIGIAFPDASPTTVNNCYAISQITILISTLACIPLVKKVSKKSLLIIGAILVAVGGGLGAMVHSMPYMLAMRCVEGIGAGFMITLIPVVIGELYDAYKAQQLIGWQAAVGCGFGALLAALSGSFAVAYGWQTSYLLYFISLVCLVLIIAFIPKTAPEKAIPKDQQAVPATINKKVWVWAIVTVLFAVLTNCIFIYEATFMMETGIGLNALTGADESAALAGASQSFLTIGSAVGGILMAILAKNLRSFLEFFCWILVAVGSFLLVIGINTCSVPLSYASCMIFGFGYGTFFPWFYAKTNIICNPGSETKSMAVINCAYFIGMFAAVYIYLGLQTGTGNMTSGFCFEFMKWAVLAVAVIFLIAGIVGRKNYKGME